MNDHDFYELLDELNAFHEAGHAVMTLLMAVPLGYVQLMTHPSQDGNGFGRTARRKAEDPESEVLIKFAGVGAELIHRKGGMQWSWLFEGTGKSDWQKAQPYLNALEGSCRAAVKNVKAKVAQLLRDNWSWVSVVASRLRERRYLTGAEVAELATDSRIESAA
jgi:hypothetical protein